MVIPGDDSNLKMSANFILESKDGKKWQAKYVKGPDWQKIIYTGKKYVAISNDSILGNSIMMSTDLNKWKINKTKIGGNIQDIVYENGEYMIITWKNTMPDVTGAIFTSKDGVKWKEVKNNKILGSYSSNNEKNNGFIDLEMMCLLWDGKQYIISGTNGMILTSKNGRKWTKSNSNDVTITYFYNNENSGANAKINKIVFDGSQYIQVGNNSTILISQNFKEGIVVRTRSNADFMNITYDGGNRYIAQSEYKTLWESKNGYEWEQVDIPIEDNIPVWCGIAAHDNIVIAPYSNIGLLNRTYSYYYSGEKGNWINKEFPFEISSIYGIKYIKNQFYLFTMDGVYTSKEGLKWKKEKSIKNELMNITYNGKVYIGQSSAPRYDYYDNTLLYSKNGNKWREINIKIGNKKYYLTASDIVWNGKQFVTIGGCLCDSDTTLKEIVGISKDGVNWKIKSTKDYFESGSYGNKTYVAIDRKGSLYTSKNGINYTKANKKTSQQLNSVMWDGKKFIVGGDMGVILASSANKGKEIPKEKKWIDMQETYTY